MRLDFMRIGLVLAAALAIGTTCGGDDEGGTATSQTTSGSSADGTGGDFTCEANGGVCGCAGGCNEGFEPGGPGLTCPQPPAEAGACSQECCVPVAGTAGGSSSTSAGATTTGAPEYCPCEVSATLPACPDQANCSGQEGEECCDAMGRLNECIQNDIGVVWLAQFC